MAATLWSARWEERGRSAGVRVAGKRGTWPRCCAAAADGVVRVVPRAVPPLNFVAVGQGHGHEVAPWAEEGRGRGHGFGRLAFVPRWCGRGERGTRQRLPSRPRQPRLSGAASRGLLRPQFRRRRGPQSPGSFHVTVVMAVLYAVVMAVVCCGPGRPHGLGRGHTLCQRRSHGHCVGCHLRGLAVGIAVNVIAVVAVRVWPWPRLWPRQRPRLPRSCVLGSRGCGQGEVHVGRDGRGRGLFYRVQGRRGHS